MFRQLIVAAAFTLVAGTAHAGCSNWIDGTKMIDTAPRAVICFKDDCELTQVDYSCGNTSFAFTAWANGWRVDHSFIGWPSVYQGYHGPGAEFGDAITLTEVRRHGVPIANPEDMKCVPVDELGCD